MTSKSSFFKLIKQEWKQKIWCPILIFVSFFLILEIQLILILQDMEKWPGSYTYSKAHYFANQFLTPDMNLLFTIMTCFAGILSAMCIFSYIHSRQKLDLFHSLPVKRGFFFWEKIVSGITFYAIPTAIHLLICVGISIGKGASSAHGINNVIGFFLTELLLFVLFYAATVFCMLLTGNMILSVLATCVILPYSLILSVLKKIVYQRFYYSAMVEYVGGVWGFSPIHMVQNMYLKMQDYRDTNTGFSYQCIGSYLPYLIAGVVFFVVVSYVLYRKRATEAAGNAIAFGITEPFIKFLIVFPVSLFAGELATNISSSSATFSWYLFGVIFGFLVSCLVVEIIFRLDIKGALKHWKQIIFNGACVALTIIVLKNDVMGFNTYIPGENEIESISCNLAGLFEYYGSDFRYYSNTDYSLENVNLKSNHSVYQLAKKLAAEGLHYTEYDSYEGIEDTPEFKEIQNREQNYREVDICYRLQNGKSVYRRYYYDITDEESLGYVTDIFNDVDYKLGSTPILQNGWNMSIKEISCNSDWNYGSIKPTEEQQNRLLDAYQSELMQLTLEQVMTELPLGDMEFEERTSNYGWKYYGGYLVYPQFTKTIAVLAECGFDFAEKVDASQVEEIRIYNYSYDLMEEEDADYIHLSYTDMEEVQEILDHVVYGGISHSNYMPIDYTYDIEVSFYNKGEKESRYMIFQKDEIPYFVENDWKALVKEYE